MREEDKYAIRIRDDNTVNYLTHDPDCGPLMSGDIQGAIKYKSFDEAREKIESLLKEPPRKFSDGSIFPPDFIHRGLGMWKEKPSADGFLEVVVIRVEQLAVWAVHGEFKKENDA